MISFSASACTYLTNLIFRPILGSTCAPFTYVAITELMVLFSKILIFSMQQYIIKFHIYVLHVEFFKAHHFEVGALLPPSATCAFECGNQIEMKNEK